MKKTVFHFKTIYVVLALATTVLSPILIRHTTKGSWFTTYTSETSANPNGYWYISKIELDKAWDIATGYSSGVKIGLIDSGVDITHPDLAGRFDTVLSKSWRQRDGHDISLEYGNGDNPHGTKTAGILCAAANNGYSVGVNWHSKIVSIRADDASGNESFDTILWAINYATNNLIPIISLSGGVYGLTSSQISSLENAVSAYPGLLVCAAGNDNVNLDNASPYYKPYPQSFTNADNVLVVGASTQLDEKRWNSNYGGNTVDIFAPGENLITTSAGYAGTTTISDTSAACPIVAGVASLIKGINMSLAPSQIKDIILTTAEYSPYLDGACVANGRINAYEALKAAIPTYVDSGSGMVCPNGVRAGENEWFKITGFSGWNEIRSTGQCVVDGELYPAAIHNGPLETALASSSYPYDFHIYWNLAYSSTYFLKSVVRTPIGSSVGVQISSHSHSYASYAWVSNTRHRGICGVCGSYGPLVSHAVTPANPHLCVLCGGYASSGVIGPEGEEPIILSEEEAAQLMEQIHSGGASHEHH